MNSKNALSEFQKILEKNNVYRNFCARELQWIENRRRTWTADKLRIGVIGVTSSGKSTLINAILGADILSSAVDPSSSQLVCCSYGKEKQIRIFFKEKPPLYFSGKDSELLRVKVFDLIDNGVVDGKLLYDASLKMETEYAAQALDEMYEKVKLL